jgi:hypothetical protein
MVSSLMIAPAGMAVEGKAGPRGLQEARNTVLGKLCQSLVEWGSAASAGESARVGAMHVANSLRAATGGPG